MAKGGKRSYGEATKQLVREVRGYYLYTLVAEILKRIDFMLSLVIFFENYSRESNTVARDNRSTCPWFMAHRPAFTKLSVITFTLSYILRLFLPRMNLANVKGVGWGLARWRRQEDNVFRIARGFPSIYSTIVALVGGIA